MSGRRSLMRAAGLSVAAMGAIPLLGRSHEARAQTAPVTDTDILNFALNLEYLEAEYYLRATTGMGLTAADTSGTVGAQGTVTGGSAVPFESQKIAGLAAEIAT